MDDSVQTALALLAADAVPVPAEAHQQLIEYLEWVKRLNDVGGFVSRGDVDRLGLHLLDSLSLVPYGLGAGRWLDIGSGGGFPAIPVALVLPETSFVLVERNERKAGLLLGALGRLQIRNASVALGSFPQVGGDVGPDIVTARAVERPEKLHPFIAPLVNAGATFYCQAGPEWWRRGMFHVEQVDDEWQDAGYRRGILYRVTRPT